MRYSDRVKEETERFNQLELDDLEIDDDEKYNRKLDSGLYTLQLIAVILGHLWTSEHPRMRARIELLLKQQKLTKNDVKNILQDLMRQASVNVLSKSKKRSMLVSLDELSDQMTSLLDIDHPCAQRHISEARDAVELKRMQSLVQDLHDELDLRDMVMVKELDDEAREEEGSPLSTEEPFSSPSLVKAGELDNKAENLEILSRIEAELQAELEMLELSMKVSDQHRISSVVELDPDFEPEIVRGELKPAMVENATESESIKPDTTADCSKPANYTVSPWELSLRLHELIESRLETRIKDLEITLLQSQNRVGIQNGIIVSRRGVCSRTSNHDVSRLFFVVLLDRG